MRGRIGGFGKLGQAGGFGLSDVLGAPTNGHEFASLVLEVPTAEDLGSILRDHPNPVRRRVGNGHVLLATGAGQGERPQHEHGKG